MRTPDQSVSVFFYLDGKKSTYFLHVWKTDMQFESHVPLENLGKSGDD